MKVKDSVIIDITGISSREEIWFLLDGFNLKYSNLKHPKIRVSTNQFFKEEDGYFLRELMMNGFGIFLSIEKTEDINEYYNLACELNIWMLGISRFKDINILKKESANNFPNKPFIIYETENRTFDDLSKFEGFDGIHSSFIRLEEMKDIEKYFNSDFNLIIQHLDYGCCIPYGLNFYHLKGEGNSLYVRP